MGADPLEPFFGGEVGVGRNGDRPVRVPGDGVSPSLLFLEKIPLAAFRPPRQAVEVRVDGLDRDALWDASTQEEPGQATPPVAVLIGGLDVGTAAVGAMIIGGDIRLSCSPGESSRAVPSWLM
jgi:hypothetical protein